MLYGIGETYRDELYTVDSDGAPVTPTVDSAVLVVNGSDTGTTVNTDTSVTGVIKVDASLAGLSNGDQVWVRVTATADGTQQITRTETARIDATISSRASSSEQFKVGTEYRWDNGDGKTRDVTVNEVP